MKMDCLIKIACLLIGFTGAIGVNSPSAQAMDAKENGSEKNLVGIPSYKEIA